MSICGSTSGENQPPGKVLLVDENPADSLRVHASLEDSTWSPPAVPMPQSTAPFGLASGLLTLRKILFTDAHPYVRKENPDHR